MALVVYWYDFICFAIVGASIFIALWMIGNREWGRECDEKSMYESLVSRCIEADGYVGVACPGYVSSTQLWTSCWRGVHPIYLLALRVVSTIILSALLAWDIKKYNPIIFMYYTEWTFSLTIFYFVLATIVSASGCLGYCSGTNGILGSEEREWEEDQSTTTISFITSKIKKIIKVQSLHEKDISARKAGFWGYLMQTVFQTCAGAVFLTDIVFWCLIVPFLSIEHFKLNLLMGCMHTFNAVFLLLDTALNNLPFPWFRFGYFVLWSCLYVIYQWVVHARGFSWWPYPFLELDTPWAPLWYFCLAVIHIPCYALFYLIVKAKYTYFPKWFPRAFVRSY